MAMTPRFQSPGPTDAMRGKKSFRMTPFSLDVGAPTELDQGDAATLAPQSFSDMVNLDIGKMNGSPADKADDGFYANLISQIDPVELAGLAQSLSEALERDIQSNKEADELLAKAMSDLGFDRTKDERSEPFPGASAVVHPMFAQSVVSLASRAMRELMPPGGPAKPNITGKQSKERIEKSERAATFLNWQVTEQCPEYRTEYEKMLVVLGLSGDTVRKLYWDDDYNRPRSEFISSDQFVVPYGTTDLHSCPRYTHILYLFKDQTESYMDSGLWARVDIPPPQVPTRSKAKEKSDKIANQSPSEDTQDQQYEFAEMHVDIAFNSLPDYEENPEPEETEPVDGAALQMPEQGAEVVDLANLTAPNSDEMVSLPGTINTNDNNPEDQQVTGATDAPVARRKRPYIFTFDRQSKKVVAVRRNWKKNDDKARKRVWFIHYKLFPWVGWRGIGLYHLIGGLQRSATGALRALLDSAAIKTMPAGLRLKGARTSGTVIKFKPLDFVEVDAPGATDIRQVAMPLPFSGPDMVMFELLGFLVTNGTNFADVALQKVAEQNPNMPVGTTMALIEEGARVYNAIHTRLHFAQKEELRLLAELNYENLEDETIAEAFGGELVVSRDDFAGDVGIVPVSDPDVSNQMQRLARSDALLNLAIKAKELGVSANLQMAFKMSAKAIGSQEADELFPDDPQAQPLDPISELMALVKGRPVDAFPGQNHKAHIAFMRAIAQNPQYQPMIEAVAPQFAALGQSHLIFSIKQDIEAQLGFSLDQLAQSNPEGLNQISGEIAKAAAQLSTEDFFGIPTNSSIDNAAKLTEVARQEIAADQQKHRLKLINDREIENARLVAKREELLMELIAKIVMKMVEVDSQTERDAAKMADAVTARTETLMLSVAKMLSDKQERATDRKIKANGGNRK